MQMPRESGAFCLEANVVRWGLPLTCVSAERGASAPHLHARRDARRFDPAIQQAIHPPGDEPGALFCDKSTDCVYYKIQLFIEVIVRTPLMADLDHEFGGQHTDLKLSIVESYLKAFTTALNRRFPRLIYIDAFAGTGSRTVRVDARAGDLFEAPVQESVEQRRGSARIAIEVVPHFTKLIFIEQNKRHFRALEDMAAAHPDRDIVIIEGDANVKIQNLLHQMNWNGARAVLFLDPYGMEVEWATLEAIAATKSIDLWFLFSLSGLYRQATRDIRSMDEDKRTAITRILGTNAWEDEIYSEETRPGLFGDELSVRRNADVKGLENYVKRRLETIFPKVFEPLPLPTEKRPQRYSLFCAISNTEPKAIGLATKIANHILKVGISS